MQGFASCSRSRRARLKPWVLVARCSAIWDWEQPAAAWFEAVRLADSRGLDLEQGLSPRKQVKSLPLLVRRAGDIVVGAAPPPASAADARGLGFVLGGCGFDAGGR
ncbi:hypothetical protein GUJ93_ZPchr0044g38086 [Zizania palustris]|uniref:Uncharacterized protein n=1 Tax=Zizania palustris TaxID=103762 RepID=A0A8J5UV53_ZIZPA|nr:hypothetical protein GUJ93_ZPchr0044g38086 [Zizania palustris]